MLPSTVERVPQHTPGPINEQIRRQTEQNVTHFSADPAAIDRRLAELDREWDIERTLEQSHPALAQGGAAAFAIETDAGEQLAAVCEIRRDARHGFDAAALHGDMAQSKRTETLDRFRNGEVQLLVASDVAARGLDIKDMSHVFCFDVPYHAEDYVHRIGRTGRAGTDGTAISLVSGSEELGYLRDIERLIRMVLPREDQRSSMPRDATPQQRVGPTVNGGHTALA